MADILSFAFLSSQPWTTIILSWRSSSIVYRKYGNRFRSEGLPAIWCRVPYSKHNAQYWTGRRRCCPQTQAATLLRTCSPGLHVDRQVLMRCSSKWITWATVFECTLRHLVSFIVHQTERRRCGRGRVNHMERHTLLRCDNNWGLNAVPTQYLYTVFPVDEYVDWRRETKRIWFVLWVKKTQPPFFFYSE